MFVCVLLELFLDYHTYPLLLRYFRIAGSSGVAFIGFDYAKEHRTTLSIRSLCLYYLPDVGVRTPCLYMRPVVGIDQSRTRLSKNERSSRHNVLLGYEGVALNLVVLHLVLTHLGQYVHLACAFLYDGNRERA